MLCWEILLSLPDFFKPPAYTWVASPARVLQKRIVFRAPIEVLNKANLLVPRYKLLCVFKYPSLSLPLYGEDQYITWSSLVSGTPRLAKDHRSSTVICFAGANCMVKIDNPFVCI